MCLSFFAIEPVIQRIVNIGPLTTTWPMRYISVSKLPPLVSTRTIGRQGSLQVMLCQHFLTCFDDIHSVMFDAPQPIQEIHNHLRDIDGSFLVDLVPLATPLVPSKYVMKIPLPRLRVHTLDLEEHAYLLGIARLKLLLPLLATLFACFNYLDMRPVNTAFHKIGCLARIVLRVSQGFHCRSTLLFRIQ